MGGEDLSAVLSTLRALAEPNGLVTSDIEWAKQKIEALTKEAERVAYNRGLVWATEYMTNKRLRSERSDPTPNKVMGEL